MRWRRAGDPARSGRDPTADVADRLAAFDGVVLPGGADVDPGRYGADRDPRTRDTVAFQDEFDFAVTREVLETGMPALAICRGMQVLNVALGGTLVQHVEETTTFHHNAVHPVSVHIGSRLHAIVGEETIEVSSYHHQALGRLGVDLIVTAVAGDGIVEAIEHRHADIVAVQWHPEDRHATSVTDAALFADLVDRARKRKDSR